MFEQEFIQTLANLQDYLDQIVIAGGWLPFIYREYVVKDFIRPFLMTKDIDIAVPVRLGDRGRLPLDKVLEESGFSRKYASLDSQTVPIYQKRVGELDIQIEFITHLRGSGKEIVIEVQKGLYAQALRYVSILLDNTINVEIPASAPISRGLSTIKVSSPGAFIFQKGLTFGRRARLEKKAKDLYYIFDVLTMDEYFKQRISDEIMQISAAYPKKWFSHFVAQITAQFAEEMSEGPTLVSLQRPLGAFPDLNDSQLRMFVARVFQGFLKNLDSG